MSHITFITYPICYVYQGKIFKKLEFHHPLKGGGEKTDNHEHNYRT